MGHQLDAVSWVTTRVLLLGFAAPLTVGVAVLAVDIPAPRLRNAVVWREDRSVELINPSRPTVESALRTRYQWLG